MNEHIESTKTERSIWLRGLLMILMGLAYQFGGTVLFLLAIIQFVLVLLNNEPDPRLTAFGRSLGRYQSQIADFVSFATVDAPFPFADWPSGKS